MQKKELEQWVDTICQKTGFIKEKPLKWGTFYRDDNYRNAIYLGKYEGKDAVLKAYDDPRKPDEPIALQYFNDHNHNPHLLAPQIYTFDRETAERGFFIMEKLPNDATQISKNNKLQFLKIFQEYKKFFPKTPHRKLFPEEELPSHQFHIARISRWFEMAKKKHDTDFPMERFLPLYQKSLSLIEKEFEERPKYWCHGHFKNEEVFFSDSKNAYYLLDFAHVHMFPLGYEEAFIVWADCLMNGDYSTSYMEWKKEIDTWKALLVSSLQEEGIPHAEELFDASMLERCLGTILADIASSDKPEKQKYYLHLFCYLEELLQS